MTESPLMHSTADNWERLQRWLNKHNAHALGSLRLGMHSDQRQWVESAIGGHIPEDVWTSWQVCDGQSLDPGDSTSVPALFLGLRLLPLLDPNLPSAVSHWRQWKQEMQQRADSSVSPSFPADAIRRETYNRAWIPLALNARGDYIGVDMDPAFNGMIGQVIAFGLNHDERIVLATSWTQFLQDLADELEANADAESLQLGVDPLPYRSWAEQKLDPAFQRVSETAEGQEETPVVTGKDAEAAAKVVSGFVEAMYEWEVDWLRERPLLLHGLIHLSETAGGNFCWNQMMVPEQFAKRLHDYRLLGPFATEDRDEAERILEIGKHYRQAIEQKQKILRKFCTDKKRDTDHQFTQTEPTTYQIGRDRVEEVRQISADHLLVYMHRIYFPRRTTRIRYHVLKIGGQWLIESKEDAADESKIKPKSL